MDTQIQRALTYLESAGRPIDLAWARYNAIGGSAQEVIDALAAFQNEDGGFGHGLEVDIKAPDSQAFAARLAMHVLTDIDASPNEPIAQRLAGWLDEARGDDTSWRFSPGVYEHELAPWFAGWTFPSLNPSLCVAGFASRLGIGSKELLAGAADLADRLASPDEIESGDFYPLLPYVEYFPWVEHSRSAEFVDLLVARIPRLVDEGKYEDADHFFTHIGPADGPLAQRLDSALIARQLDRLRDEQLEDGGWPSPYGQDWRPWITAEAVRTLTDFES